MDPVFDFHQALKYFVNGFWFITGDIVVLIWGMWLCYKIRNAPAAYNESKYISWAIYNAMFVTSFLMVVRLV